MVFVAHGCNFLANSKKKFLRAKTASGKRGGPEGPPGPGLITLRRGGRPPADEKGSGRGVSITADAFALMSLEKLTERATLFAGELRSACDVALRPLQQLRQSR